MGTSHERLQHGSAWLPPYTVCSKVAGPHQTPSDLKKKSTLRENMKMCMANVQTNPQATKPLLTVSMVSTPVLLDKLTRLTPGDSGTRNTLKSS